MSHAAAPPGPDRAVAAVALALAHRGPAGLAAALAALVSATGLAGAALRAAPQAGGGTLAVAGALPAAGLLELPVPLPGSAAAVPAAVLVLPADRPDLLPDLRAAAAVLGLALVARGVDAGVLERDRDLLADRLHDGALQDLLVARLAADAAVRGGSPVLARDAVQSALVGLRRLLWHVRPRTGDDLPAALGALSERLVESGGLPLRVLGALPAGLEPGVAAAAYRVVQAVAVDAGPADRPVTVALRPDPARPGAVVLDVDGGGALADPQHWRDRLRGVGGELDDLPDAAGRLRVVLPLSPRTSCAPPVLLTASSPPTSKATP